MAEAPRIWTVAYGGLTVGDGTSYDLHDVFISDRDYGRFSVTFTVVATAATSAAFKTLSDALYSAYRTVNSDLTVTVNSQNLVALSHSSNTGYNSRPSIRDLPSHRTEISGAWECTVECELPADESGKGGRRSTSVEITTQPGSSRKVLHVVAEYTATGGNSAENNVNDGTTGLAAYADSLETALGGTWDTSPAIVLSHDQENKTATARVTRRQLLFAQGPNATDETGMEDVTYSIQTIRPTTRRYPNSDAEDFVTIVVSFQAPLVQSVTGTSDAAIQSYYESTILPYITTLAQTTTGIDVVPTILDESVGRIPTTWTVGGSVTFRVHRTNLLSLSVRKIHDRTTGKALSPVADGGDLTYDVQKVVRQELLEIRALAVEFGSAPTAVSRAVFDKEVAAAVAQGYVELRVRHESEPFEEVALTDNGPDSFFFVETLYSALLQKVTARKKAGKGPKSAKGQGNKYANPADG